MSTENDTAIVVQGTTTAPVQVAAPVEIEALSGGPLEMLRKAKDISTALAQVVREAKLTTTISGKEYVQVEGWNVLGTMLGVFPQVEWCRRVGTATPFVYETRVNLYHMASGRIVCSAEGMASGAERGTWTSNEYSIRSMSQTRTTGKAYRLGFSWVMKLAGYEPTPAEEMPEQLAQKAQTALRKTKAAGGAKDAPKEATKAPAVHAAPSVAEVVDDAPQSENPAPEDAVDPFRETQRRRLWAVCGKCAKKFPKALGFLSANDDKSRADRLRLFAQYLGEDVASSTDLTGAQMSSIADQLLAEYKPDALDEQGAS